MEEKRKKEVGALLFVLTRLDKETVLPRKKRAPTPFSPTPEQVAAARGKRIPDVLRPGLSVVFCGINPSLYSAAVGHHFARPGNRFWPTLHGAGFTDRLFSPFDDVDLMEFGYGLTNLVGRATARADELSAEELIAGAKRLKRKLRKLRPACIAFLGVTAYRAAFDLPQATIGRQADELAGSTVWVLPNPSGLNAHYQLPDLVSMFEELRTFCE